MRMKTKKMKVRIRKDLVPNQRSLVDDDDDDDDDAEDDEEEGGHGHSHGGARGGHQHGKHGAGGVSSPLTSFFSPMIISSSLIARRNLEVASRVVVVPVVNSPNANNSRTKKNCIDVISFFRCYFRLFVGSFSEHSFYNCYNLNASRFPAQRIYFLLRRRK